MTPTPPQAGERAEALAELLAGCRNLLNLLRTVSGTDGTKVYSCIESRGGSLVNVESTIAQIDAALDSEESK